MSENVVTRVDFKDKKDGVHVYKYYDGWTASSDWQGDYEFHVNRGTTVTEMAEWFKTRGWIVREWPGGGRAFRKGTVMPVRTRANILALRKALQQQLYENNGHHPMGIEINTLDLAIDL